MGDDHMTNAGIAKRPEADADFCDILLPYEIRLAQRRTMSEQSYDIPELARSSLGLYLIRVEPPGWDDEASDHGVRDIIDNHVRELMKSALRDSDIPCFLGRREHLAIARDLDADHAYVVAQRMLGAAARSDFLNAANIRVLIGYIVYPLSTPPNFPMEDWRTLVKLARNLATRDQSGARTAGFGLLSGPEASKVGMPEAELIPVAVDSLDQFLDAELLKIQRIQVMG